MFRSKTPKEAVDLVSKILKYSPDLRLPPLEAIMHPFFDELRDEDTKLPNGNPLPDLFNFSKEELMQADPKFANQLIPDWYAAKHGHPTD